VHLFERFSCEIADQPAPFASDFSIKEEGAMSVVINKKTLSEQIYQSLRHDILIQEIKSGQKLTLQYLKDRFEVSHTPIREALTHLVEDDLVRYYSNVGVTVVNLTVQDAQEIFQLCGDLDCLAMQYCCRGTQMDVLLDELDDTITLSKKYLQKKQIKQWSEFSDRFHLIFYKYANNSRLEAAAHKLRAQITLLSNLYQLDSQNVDNIQLEHERIYEALKNGDVTNGIVLMRHHLDQALSYAIEAIQKQSD
jgi:DNA-binding GntR family transcriptional regulator